MAHFQRVAGHLRLFLSNNEQKHFLTILGTPVFNPLSANPTKWSNTLKQFVGKLPTNCLSVFDHFVGLAFKGSKVMKLTSFIKSEKWRAS